MCASAVSAFWMSEWLAVLKRSPVFSSAMTTLEVGGAPVGTAPGAPVSTKVVPGESKRVPVVNAAACVMPILAIGSVALIVVGFRRVIDP